MADIFSTMDARNLLNNKYVSFIGDSNVRNSYKDLILLLDRNEMMNIEGFKRKGEQSFEGDQLVNYIGRTKGRSYIEHRKFNRFSCEVEFQFTTRCYSDTLEKYFKKIKTNEINPDVIIMNSCLWDISRWGPNGVSLYKDNLVKLLQLLKQCLPAKTLFIWLTTPPIAHQLEAGSLLVEQISFLNSILPYEVVIANLFCRDEIVKYGFDILDIHYFLRMQQHRHQPDGIHFGPYPVRFATCQILTHIALSWNVPLPGNWHGKSLDRIISECDYDPGDNLVLQLPNIPASLMINEPVSHGGLSDFKKANTPYFMKMRLANRSFAKTRSTSGRRIRGTALNSHCIDQRRPQIHTNDNYTENSQYHQFPRYFDRLPCLRNSGDLEYNQYSNFDQVSNNYGPIRQGPKFHSTRRHCPY